MKHLPLVIIVPLALCVAACNGYSGIMDGLGRESAVTETARNKSQIEDDRIEDKHPEYDPARTVDEAFGSECVVRLNKSRTVTKLDIVKPDEADKALAARVFPSRASAAKAIDGRLDSETSLIPSIEVVNGAMKPFNDGLYATVEEGVQLGLTGENDEEIYPSKQRFLGELLTALLEMGDGEDAGAGYFADAATDIGTALIIGGQTPALPEAVQAEASARVALFEENPIVSRPIGFYTWTATLEQIFGQDRYLQNYQGEQAPYRIEEIGKAAALALAIDADNRLKERYEGYLALYAGLTNPFMNYPVTALLPYLDGEASLDDIDAVADAFLKDNPPPDLSPACQPRLALFPSSVSKETAFFESQFCKGGAPSDINYMDALIAAIRDGRVDLTPGKESGWYDYQSHALEVLLLPERGSESQHLLLTKAYKEKLVESFKSIMTQNRETHVKQLEMGFTDASAAMDPIDIYPNFPAEPFPTFYLRSARAYRFLHTYLSAVLGQAFLDRTHRMTEEGDESEASLATELWHKAMLLYGLHLLTADAVGMAPELLDDELEEFEETECRDLARNFTVTWLDDVDVARDSRVMLPVQREPDFGVVVYWATLGTRVIETSAEFVEGYEPEVVHPSYDEMPAHLEEEDRWYCDVDEMVAHHYFLLVDTFAEVRLPEETPPPTRAELRKILDRYDTVDEMIAALEAL